MTRHPLSAVHPMHALNRRQVLAGTGSLAAATIFGNLPGTAQQPLKTTLAYGSTGYTWTVPYVAEEGGYWKGAGVDIVAKTFETGRDAMQALLTGAADFSTSADTPFVFAALNGLRPIALVNYSRYSRDMKVAVSTTSGIDPSKPASLKGKKIGTRIGTSGQYFLAKYLKLAGLSPQDITVVDLAPSNLATALTRGDIDGFAWTSQTVGVAKRQTSGKVVEMAADGIEKYFQSHQLLLTTDRVLKEKPQLVETAVRVLFEAEKRIAADPKWPEIISDRIKTPPADIAEAAKSFSFKVGFDERFLDDLVAHAEWAIESGAAKKRPSGDLRALFRGLIAEGPTKAIRPDRVTIA